MKTDTIFYQLFQNFPSIFFELIGQPATNASNYQFTSPGDKARQLISKARLELTDAVIQQQIIELIETIGLYKFPNLSREELENMLGLSELKQTRVYQEARQEGLEEGIEQGQLQAKLGLIPRLQQRGLSVEEIAELLELDVETIRQAFQQQS